jgi:hypothetical protein
MLGTATVAAVSMAFALHNAVLVVIDPDSGGPTREQPVSHLVVSVILGLFWGALILVLDRALIRTMHGVAGPRAVWYALPRLALAVLIGVVVSTPITLQIFRSEIAAQVKEDQDAQIESMKANAEKSQTAKKLADLNKKITEQEGIVKGIVPGLSSPEVDTAQANYAAAVKSLEQTEKAKDKAYLVMICELEGAGSNPKCESLASQKAGDGPLYKVRKQEYENAVEKFERAQGNETSARAKLEAAQNTANNENKGAVEAAQVQANVKLCGLAKSEPKTSAGQATVDSKCEGGLRVEAIRLNKELGRLENGDLIRQKAGLHAQIVALGKLSSRDGGAGAHWLVALLFMAIELLPVIIKTFIAVRGVTQYDRIAKKLHDDEYDAVESDTDAVHAQRNREVKKRETIRDDMLHREIDLGKTANKHVAGEMEAILSDALTNWSAQVKATIASNPGRPGTSKPGSARTSPPFGLPDANDL